MENSEMELRIPAFRMMKDGESKENKGVLLPTISADGELVRDLRYFNQLQSVSFRRDGEVIVLSVKDEDEEKSLDTVKLACACAQKKVKQARFHLEAAERTLDSKIENLRKRLGEPAQEKDVSVLATAVAEKATVEVKRKGRKTLADENVVAAE